MRVIAGIVAVFSLAVVVGSAAWVMAKQDSPALSVRVEGVPGYVYYNRAYDLTVHYANAGGGISGPVELAVQLPETFALAEHIEDPTRHGERLIWQLDGLDTGQSGSVTFAVRGTLPEDLTNAVYDLPGYVGHTAFVEGFEMAVSLTADGASAEALAVANTGEAGPGSVIVNKECLTDQILVGSFNMRLLDDEGQLVHEALTSCGALVAFEDLESGTYSVEEQILGGNFVEVSNDCAELVIVQDETSDQCTFVNAEPGSIRIIKDTNPETSDISFDFDGDLGDFDLEDDGSTTFSDLAPGEYTITENPAAGWELVDIDCGTADYTVSLGTESVTVDLSPGEDVTCTFVNEEEEDEGGTIIITKDVNPEPDGTDFFFSDNIPGCTIGTLDDDGVGGVPNSVTCTGVPPGDYIVTESGSSAYLLVDIDCDDPDSQSSASGHSAFIDLDPGETVHCVFTNQAVAPTPVSTPTGTGTGSITIKKDTNPENDDARFMFDSPFGPFELKDDGSKTFSGLASGIYVIEERGQNGWLLANVICNDNNSHRSGHSAFIELDPGQHVTCEFINEAAKPAPDDKKPTPKPSPPVIAPPSTGEAGLADASGTSWPVTVAVLVVASGVAWLSIRSLAARRS